MKITVAALRLITASASAALDISGACSPRVNHRSSADRRVHLDREDCPVGCRSRRVTNRPLEQLRRHVGLIQSDAESVFLTNRRYLCSEDS